MGLFFNKKPKNAIDGKELDMRAVPMAESLTVNVNADKLVKAFESEGFVFQKGATQFNGIKPIYVKGATFGKTSAFNMSVRINNVENNKANVFYSTPGGQKAVDYILSIIKKVN